LAFLGEPLLDKQAIGFMTLLALSPMLKHGLPQFAPEAVEFDDLPC